MVTGAGDTTASAEPPFAIDSVTLYFDHPEYSGRTSKHFVETNLSRLCHTSGEFKRWV